MKKIKLLTNKNLNNLLIVSDFDDSSNDTTYQVVINAESELLV